MSDLIMLPICCQGCNALPCECDSAVEMTEEVPLDVVEFQTEETVVRHGT